MYFDFRPWIVDRIEFPGRLGSSSSFCTKLPFPLSARPTLPLTPLPARQGPVHCTHSTHLFHWAASGSQRRAAFRRTSDRRPARSWAGRGRPSPAAVRPRWRPAARAPADGPPPPPPPRPAAAAPGGWPPRTSLGRWRRSSSAGRGGWGRFWSGSRLLTPLITESLMQ